MMRAVPCLPAPGKKIKLIIDSDAANEIDDLYAAAEGFGPEAYRTNEYFSPEGAKALGRAAAQAIRRMF